MTAKRRIRKIKKRIATHERAHPRLGKHREEEAGTEPRVITKGRLVSVSIDKDGLGCVHVEGEDTGAPCKNGCDFKGTFIVEDSEQVRFETDEHNKWEENAAHKVPRGVGDHGSRTPEEERKEADAELQWLAEEEFIERYIAGEL